MVSSSVWGEARLGGTSRVLCQPKKTFKGLRRESYWEEWKKNVFQRRVYLLICPPGKSMILPHNIWLLAHSLSIVYEIICTDVITSIYVSFSVAFYFRVSTWGIGMQGEFGILRGWQRCCESIVVAREHLESPNGLLKGNQAEGNDFLCTYETSPRV